MRLYQTKMTCFLIIVILIGLSCCNSNRNTDSNTIILEETGDTQNHTFKNNNDSIKSENEILVGEKLFKAILDTITKRHIDNYLLINSDWLFKVTDDCTDNFVFKPDNIGVNYNCEVDESNEINYNINNDTLYIQEFEVTGIDDMPSRMTRSDKYIYNGNSLILISSVTYYGGDRPRIPKIKEIIAYRRINKH